jgi:hypothetical protein
MATGEEVTIEGEVVTADHENIIMPDGEVISNVTEAANGDGRTSPDDAVVYTRHSTELPS